MAAPPRLHDGLDPAYHDASLYTTVLRTDTWQQQFVSGFDSVCDMMKISPSCRSPEAGRQGLNELMEVR